MKSSSIHYLRLESAALNRDVIRAFEAASDFAEQLRDVGVGADDVLTDAFADEAPEKLHLRATRLRGAALHAVSLAIELSAQAGRPPPSGLPRL
jgi:hypothetical protein